MIELLCLVILAAEPAPSGEIVDAAGKDYVTALDTYILAQVAEMHGQKDKARAYLLETYAARDRAIALYQQQERSVETERRIKELAAIDKACCGQTSMARRLNIEPSSAP
jgi:hypothetical protein